MKRHLNNELVCRQYLQRERWGDKVICLYCECDKVYAYKDLKYYRCSSCKKTFSVLKGTIFEHSKISLVDWYDGICFYMSDKRGVSSVQIADHLDIAQSTAWYMHQRIMQLCKTELDKIERQPGVWEIDEVYVGPNKFRMNKQTYKKTINGKGYIHMTAIMAFLHRGDKLFGKVLNFNTGDKVIVQPIIKKFIHPLATIYSDASTLYLGLNKYFNKHESFVHKKHDYGKGERNSNSIEGSFRQFKDIIRGTYKRLTFRYLQRYWDEYCFRYNTRKIKNIEKVRLAFKNIYEPIKYKRRDLIGKSEEEYYEGRLAMHLRQSETVQTEFDFSETS